MFPFMLPHFFSQKMLVFPNKYSKNWGTSETQGNLGDLCRKWVELFVALVPVGLKCASLLASSSDG